MLHAELKGKLDPNATDLERREDVLTSTVFGTILIADGGAAVLADWFNRARRVGSDCRLNVSADAMGVPVQPSTAWFWPKLREAEPDVVVRVGSHLLVVEAKYGSTKGSGAAADEETRETVPSADQLLRQWRSVQPEPPAWYPAVIADAVRFCDKHVVYLVSSRHESQAVREIAESQQKSPRDEPAPAIWLLTWQDLHATLLAALGKRGSISGWIGDLAGLLARRNLGAFLGFSQALGSLPMRAPVAHVWASLWRGDRLATMKEELARIDLRRLTERMQTVETWATGHRQRPSAYFSGLADIDFRVVSRIAQRLPSNIDTPLDGRSQPKVTHD